MIYLTVIGLVAFVNSQEENIRNMCGYENGW